MGGKQSSNARTRAFSSSDVPSPGHGGSSSAAYRGHRSTHGLLGGTSASSSSATSSGRNPPIGIPGGRVATGPGVHGSGADDVGGGRQRLFNMLSSAGMSQSLPVQLTPHLLGGLKCPICSKFVASDEVEAHLVMCLTKPHISYNEDVLAKDSGECPICLDDMDEGNTIARLPCLCIYHKQCIDSWFEVNRSCPEHPSD
ncbi:E3 ubiquitin-protein ligase znrf2-like isoform X1 [Petromyzon marinus]|uniref:E3 ubiquitin-protein ligase znrf2-like isoform X1 n=1 Tax=Petromyzon marinus TaxID=7757 RepID=UPI003F720CB6